VYINRNTYIRTPVLPLLLIVPDAKHATLQCTSLTATRPKCHLTFLPCGLLYVGGQHKAEEIRNQHLGFAASMTSTLPHFKIMHFFFNELVDIVG
jgi:hypothetical protein